MNVSSFSFHGLRVTSAIALPELRRRRGDSSIGDLAIDLGGAPDDSDRDWFHAWPLGPRGRGPRRRAWLSFARSSTGYLLRFHELADFEVRDGGKRITCRPVRGLPPAAMRHLLLAQVMPLVLSQSSRLALHASAVHVERFGTLAFAGRAGAGKSTLAAAVARRCSCEVVTDDCLVIEPAPSRPVVIPECSAMRLWPDASRALRLASDRRDETSTAKQRVGQIDLRFRTRPTPLRAIFVLGRRRAPGRPTASTPLRSRDALLALTQFSYLMDVGDRRQLATVFGQLATVVERVPVARLSIRNGWRAMGQAADEVLALATADS